ncbi:Uu.00g082460.m01.CDS01 [Anthostomella pinea]|uniref:Uu.00g082460.m01.CDS01 n=1 Tax=Anthostomella pinea TaxID=933095 RepID=A0AAI8VMJ2_9PEZI|nr:Uu.00g082460.m01.CDS01 [Anthostomella pinea]
MASNSTESNDPWQLPRLAHTNTRRISDQSEDLAGMTAGASAAAQAEKEMTLREALVSCRKAVLWSVLFTSSVIMEGFDLALLSGFYAYPQFLKAYGRKHPEIDKHELPPTWQTALSAGAMIGQIIGLSIAGLVAQRIGYKRTMIGALSLMIAFIFIPFFADSLEKLFVGEIMQGIPWGVFETMPAAYASEISPLALRPYITTWANMCWVLGQLIAAAVLRGFLHMENQWAYRIPFALQWVWPIPILALIFFAPESPWWLERNGQSDRAKLSFRRLTNYKTETIQNTMELIKHTIAIENRHHIPNDRQSPWLKIKSTLSTYVECFKGVDRRKTEITCLAWASQSLCGSNLMAFAPYFFTIAGLETAHAYTLQLGGMALGACGVVGAWFLMSRAGRRTIYVWGLFTLFFILLTIGLLGAFALKRDGAAWVIAILLLLYIVVYDLTVGPCCYCIVTEFPSTRLRAATVALARICYNVCGILSVTLNPRMLNTLGWNWGPKAALLWAGLCFLCWCWAFWRLPEPKGRNFGELDVMFQQKIKARDFKKQRVDQFGFTAMDVKRSEAKRSNHVETPSGGTIQEEATSV